MILLMSTPAGAPSYELHRLRGKFQKAHHVPHWRCQPQPLSCFAPNHLTPPHLLPLLHLHGCCYGAFAQPYHHNEDGVDGIHDFSDLLLLPLLTRHPPSGSSCPPWKSTGFTFFQLVSLNRPRLKTVSCCRAVSALADLQGRQEGGPGLKPGSVSQRLRNGQFE